MRDLAIELAGDAYAVIQSGQLGVDAQVLNYIVQHPGCSKNTVRSNLGMKRETVDDTVRMLLDRGMIENRGTGRAHQYHAVEAQREREPGEERVPF
jgi:predicted transcriptional regulator